MKSTARVKIISILLVLTSIILTTPASSKSSKNNNSKKIQSISAQQLLEDSFSLAKLVFESNFRPTFLIALWRGGTPIGIAIEEYFSYKNAPIKNHTAVRVSAYNHDQLKNTAKVFNLEYVVKTIKSNDKLLIVDDILDSGTSLQTLLKEIDKQCKENKPKIIKIATLYFNTKSETLSPNYYLHKKLDTWLVFPHELEGLNKSEIRKLKGWKISNATKS